MPIDGRGPESEPRGCGVKIAEIMSREVISVDFEMPVDELEGILTEKGISGVPVISSDGELMGVVSKTDLIRFRGQRQGLDPRLAADSPGHVWEVMTPHTLSVDAEDDVRDVARRMLEAGVHRVLVYEAGKVEGVVTSFDMLKVIVAS